MDRRVLAGIILIMLSIVILSSRSEAQLITSHIVINEFEQDPEGDDRSGGEFIELFNPTNSSVDISNWTICTTRDICNYTIPQGTILDAGPSWFIINFSGEFIDNLADSLVLRDNNGSKVDETPILADVSNDDNDWQRIPDAGEEWQFVLATKNSNNGANPIPEFPNPLFLMVLAIVIGILTKRRKKRIDN